MRGIGLGGRGGCDKISCEEIDCEESDHGGAEEAEKGNNVEVGCNLTGVQQTDPSKGINFLPEIR